MPEARINTERARKALQDFRFADLFINELGWNNPTSRTPIALQDANGNRWEATEISQLSGFRVFEVVPDDAALSRPDAKNQQILWKSLTAQAVENIAIFVDPKRTQSLWLWMKRDGKRVMPRKHAYIKGQPGDLFLSKLSALVVDLSELDEEGNLPITETANRVRAALDVEVVTKTFFKRFQDVHGAFLEEIDGIPDEGERRWYASVILNRLMFIWFLQKKGFVDRADRPDGNRNYLRDKLAVSPKGKNQFYPHFLRDLFFEGFAKPENKRKPTGTVSLGDIPYLNGGLFLPHGIEQRVEGNSLLAGPFARIKISDSAFKDVFELFDSYSWNLNDVPGGDDREINPAVLGYIFEKYINQKEFGAYYTRLEITEYLCEQTIHRLVIDAANKHVAGQKLLVQHGLKKEAATADFESVGDVLLRADSSLCRELLQTFLPQLSILDPACGSGAFLVAGLKTLLAIYTGLLGRAEAVQEKAVLQWVELEKRKHKAPVAYWLKKKIITENLFGVDIMEEAVEIAKLRLFLALVASAERRDHLEPLPNIEFNLMHGNSLIGLLHVDPKKFDSSTTDGQGRMTLLHEPTAKDLGFAVESKTAPTAKEKVGAHLAEKRARKYDELLREKNRLVDLYKRSSLDFEDLTALKQSIESKKDDARAILNKLLLDEFIGLGIQFQHATWDVSKGREGKPERRSLRITDIEALKPFHWAYEFDEIIVSRGGFDAIITNPPWENFKPQGKEFFATYSKLVTINKMVIKEFEAERTKLMRQEEVRDAWLEYSSRFPHQNLFFRNSPQYTNQRTVVVGKRVSIDLNFYKLFTEQCFNLIHSAGKCGIVVPSGIYSDLGTTQLRRLLFDRTRITGLFGFENRRMIFENVDSRFKFVVLTFNKGGATDTFPAAFMRHDVKDLEGFPDGEALDIPVSLIRRLSPDSLSVVEFKELVDIQIAEKMVRFPLLGEKVPGKWNLLLSREFHMTDDSHLFKDEQDKGRLPLYEGKMIHQFDSNFAEARYWIDEQSGRKVIVGSTADQGQLLDYQDYRFCMRRIARNTDERTLISTILPKHAFGSESLHLSTGRSLKAQELLFLVGVLNTFVLDACIRQRVAANVNMFYVYQLPVPRIDGLETDKVEFKEGAAYSTQRNQKSPDMIRNFLREVAAFLNSGGGNVILGVTDTGKVVGIAGDLQHADPKKKNRDGYELFLRNSIVSKLGTIQSSTCKISFHKIDNLEVCRIFVPASSAPVYLDDNLIIRDGTSSRQLNAQETQAYIAQHWPSVT